MYRFASPDYYEPMEHWEVDENTNVDVFEETKENYQSESVGVHSLTLSCTPGSMKCDSWAHSWPAPLQALALAVSPRLGLRHLGSEVRTPKVLLCYDYQNDITDEEDIIFATKP
jgi:hypothetical protein